MPTTIVVYRRVSPTEPETPGQTATGHQIGRTYFSLRHRMRYTALRVATVWEFAPGARTLVQWENGNTTTTEEHRGADPEVCTRCGGELASPREVGTGEPCRCAP